MNTRQQLYKKNRLAGMNQYNAAIAAGYSENYARNARPEKVVKGCLADEFERQGLTDKAIVAYALEGLKAMRPIAADVMIKQENGKLIAVKNENDWVEIEDWANRHKFFNTILELTEKIKHKVEHSGTLKVELAQALDEAQSRLENYVRIPAIQN